MASSESSVGSGGGAWQQTEVVPQAGSEAAALMMRLAGAIVQCLQPHTPPNQTGLAKPYALYLVCSVRRSSSSPPLPPSLLA
ncbi:hypothetical protein HaLaN_06077 [Haematococcus lacustris]|uniref:Uncharacterized protein n=1 Tax=Haematococcus lacustris TaxID=44745 RepID=A0A699YN23_HAELA|nr:hypothetical protein HaLaN_06077 [Haematococcus lacustris]